MGARLRASRPRSQCPTAQCRKPRLSPGRRYRRMSSRLSSKPGPGCCLPTCACTPPWRLPWKWVVQHSLAVRVGRRRAETLARRVEPRAFRTSLSIRLIQSYPSCILRDVTGRELRAARQHLGLTQKALARQVGLHWNSIARQERGEVTISGPLARLIRLLVGQKDTTGRRRRERRRGKQA